MSDRNKELEERFRDSMLSIYVRAKKEAGYNATRFLQMLEDRGPLETARLLINRTTPSDGFTALWEAGRLDLTVEAHALDPQFEPLFTADERRVARDRLQQYGFNPRPPQPAS
jgi:hypothetical protein